MDESSLFNKMELATKQILLPISSLQMSYITSERKSDLLIFVASSNWLCNLGHGGTDGLQQLKAI